MAVFEVQNSYEAKGRNIIPPGRHLSGLKCALNYRSHKGIR